MGLLRPITVTKSLLDTDGDEWYELNYLSAFQKGSAVTDPEATMHTSHDPQF